MAKRKAVDLTASEPNEPEVPTRATPPHHREETPVPVDAAAEPTPEAPKKSVHPTVNPRDALLKSLHRSSMVETGNDEAAALSDDETEIDNDAPPPNRAALAAEAAAAANAAAESDENEEPDQPAPKSAPADTTPTPAEPKRHKVVVRGVETEVEEQQVIEAGLNAMRHHGAAERALREASDLLNQAKASVTGTPAPKGPPSSNLDEDAKSLAHSLQFGSQEEAARAVAAMMKGGHSMEDISGVVARTVETHVRDVLDHEVASKALEAQVPEMLKDTNILAILSFEEKAARVAGDKRPYSQLYPVIGKKVRDWIDGLKGPAPATPQPNAPAQTLQQRAEAKRAAPASVPPATGASTQPNQPKPRTASDIVNEMRNRRGNPDFRNQRRI